MLAATWVLYGTLLSVVLSGFFFSPQVSVMAGLLLVGFFALLGALDQWLTPETSSGPPAF